MKKILFITFSLTALILFFSSCKDEEDIYSPGVAIGVSDANYFPLDPGVSGTLQISKATGEVTATLVTSPDTLLNGSNLGVLTIVDSIASYSFTKAKLGLFKIDDNSVVQFGSTSSTGVPVVHSIKFYCNDPFSISESIDTNYVDSIKYGLASNCTAPTSIIITRYKKDTVYTDSIIHSDFAASGYLVEQFDTTMIGDTICYQFNYSNQYGSVDKTYTLVVPEKPE